MIKTPSKMYKVTTTTNATEQDNLQDLLNNQKKTQHYLKRYTKQHRRATETTTKPRAALLFKSINLAPRGPLSPYLCMCGCECEPCDKPVHSLSCNRHHDPSQGGEHWGNVVSCALQPHLMPLWCGFNSYDGEEQWLFSAINRKDIYNPKKKTRRLFKEEMEKIFLPELPIKKPEGCERSQTRKKLM